MKHLFNKFATYVLLPLFILNTVIPPDFARAQLIIPTPTLLVPLSPHYSPINVRGMSIYLNDPFKFDFIIDNGDDHLSGSAFKNESQKMIKYFLAALTVPEKELWVNLSPYEKNRVIPQGLGDTQMGVDMLAQDFLLKRITASLTYPESNLGKKFWDRVYKQASQKYGTTDIPVNTYNKVWIAPDKAVVYEKNNHVFIAERHLRVMLEEDYLALQKHSVPSSSPTSNIVRSIILPELEKEVNTGKNFANLRQIYNALILATWYKKKLKDSILAQIYANKNKVEGLSPSRLPTSQPLNVKATQRNEPSEVELIYQQYLNVFKKGVYNYVKEDVEPVSGQSVPRKYFSGGISVGAANVKDLAVLTDAAQLSSVQKDFITHPQSSGDDVKVTWEALGNPVNPDMAATSALPFQARILDRREAYPRETINPVRILPAIEFPDLEPANRRAGEIPLLIVISDDLKSLTYYHVLDDSRVYHPDGSVNYNVLSEANGTISKIASFPSSYLVSPRKWMLDHFKDSPEGVLISSLWRKGKRYTRYRGVTTSWDMGVDKDVWSFNGDTGYFLKTLYEDVLPFLKHDVNNITEGGVGEGGISATLTKIFPHAKLSGTDISSYALRAYLLNVIANNPQGIKALDQIKKYWGADIESIGDKQDLIVINPPYIPVAPFEKMNNDPYSGTAFIREVIQDGYKKLNPYNPEAAIYINISSLADKDVRGYIRQFGGNIEFEKVGKPHRLPLKIKRVNEDKRWMEWLLHENGGLEKIENPAADQEEYWHTLQMYRIRRKTEVPQPKKVAIIGGTFDPFHIAHRKMVEDIKAELGADEVIVVPTYESPHKIGVTKVSGELRFQMAKAALAGLEGIEVSDYEVKRHETNYSIDLYKHFASKYPPGSKFFMVIGDDDVEKLDTWQDIRELASKVKFVAYSRPGYEKPNKLNIPVLRLEHPEININATMIRQRVAIGASISTFVAPEVERIIKENNLYQPEEVFATEDLDKPILSLNKQPFKEDKPYALVLDVHGTLLISNWKKEYAEAFSRITGKSFNEGLKWVDNNIVRQLLSDTTRDVPYDEIISMLVREAALNDIHIDRERIEGIVRESRQKFWNPNEAEAMAGAIEALRAIKAMGIPIKFVSGTRSSQLVYDQLQAAGFGDLIPKEDVYAKDRQLQAPVTDNIELSPRGRMIKHIMDGFPDHNLLLLDDWTEGAEIAKQLNGTFIALPQGTGDEQKRNSQALSVKQPAMEIMDARGYERLVSLLKAINERRKKREENMIIKNVRVAMAQINPTVGNLVENYNRLLQRINEAKSKQADMIVFPELSMTGYLPGHLLRNREFVEQNKNLVRILAQKTKGITTVVGFVDINRYGQIYNALAVLSDGEVKGIYRKRALPNYNHFMEKYYFIPGELGLFDFNGNKLDKDIFNIDGLMFGINDCEDIWVEKDGHKAGLIDGTTVQEPVDHHVVAPYKQQADLGARLIINSSASPYRNGVLGVRDNMLIKRALDMHATVLYVNTVGGQDETVFDGNSLGIDQEGRIFVRAKGFEEQMIIMDIKVKTEKRTPKELAATITVNKVIPDADKTELPPVLMPEPDTRIGLIVKAAVLGLRDYARKNGFKTVNVGDSGGIDSAVVMALATMALGPENVNAMSLPTKFNSPGTKDDARRVAEILENNFEEVPIQGAFKLISEQLLADTVGTSPKAVQLAMENLQPRLRMAYLMFRSNAEGYLLLGTGNKSEIAVGYMTLYGDMAGGYDPIKDIYKTDVFEIARYLNKYFGKELIPESLINRPPSAELREGQKDTDSLPDYVTELDPILRLMVDESLPDKEIALQTKLPLDMVIRVRKLLDGADFKRRQAQIGPKLEKVAFGHYERRMPLTKKWDAQATAAFITVQQSADQAMLTGIVPLHRLLGEKRVIEIESNKGPIRMEISQYPDNEIHTILLDPEKAKSAKVTLAHWIDNADDVLQAILIMDHLRQYGVGSIDLLVKGQRFTQLEDGKDDVDSYLMTALSSYADHISYIDNKNYVHEVKNIQPMLPANKAPLPIQIDRLLYLNNQFQSSAKEALKILSSNAKAQYVTIQNRHGIRLIDLPLDLKGKNVVVYHSTESSDEIINLVLTLIALREHGVKSISLINSYLGYARQDKAQLPGEAIAAETVLKLINYLVDHHYVINAHYGKETGLVELQGKPGTGIYNLNGFVPLAESLFNRIVSKIANVANVEGLSLEEAQKLGPQIEKEFNEHPIVIVAPDKGSKIYAQEAARELERLVKLAYGVDIHVYVGYIPKNRDPGTGKIERSDNPAVLNIETDQRLNLPGGIPLKKAWALVLDDMTDTGGTILSADYILVRKLGFPWERVLTGIVHGVLSQKLLPFRTGLTADEIKNANDATLPQASYIDDVNGRLPPILLTALQTLVLPPETPTFKQVPMQNLVGYVIRRIIGAGLNEKQHDSSEELIKILADDRVPFWQWPARDYILYLNKLRRNHSLRMRNILNPPVYTDPEVKRHSRSLNNLNGPAHTDFDGIFDDELVRRKKEIYEDVMRTAPDTKFIDGRPVNDLETGMTGRGKLFKYGPNQAEDPIFLRINQQGELEVLIIDRTDDTGSGFPGGFSNKGQEKMIGNTATREGIEEVLKYSNYAVDFRKGKLIYDGKAFSSRDTNNAWVTTRAIAVLISWEKSQLLTFKASDDAQKDSARWEKVNLNLLSQMVDAHPEILKNAVQAYVSGDLQVRDDLVVPNDNDQLLEEVTNEVAPDKAMKTSLTPNTLSELSKIRIDSSFLDILLTPEKKKQLEEQLIKLNPGYDPAKLFHMMFWDPREYDREHMPVIVGEIKDKKAFSTQRNYRKLDEAKRMPDQGWALSKEDEQFREVFQIAVNDQRLINPDFDKYYYAYLTVDQKIVPPHTSQRRPGWHGDAFVSSETSDLYDVDGQQKNVVTDSTYVISDALPTLFYPGPFSLKGVNTDDIRAVLKRFEEIGRDKMPFKYPPYVLLRMTPYDLHTPDFNNTDHPITRTFVKIQFSRDRLNRGGNAINPLLNYDGWYWVPRGTERNNRNTLVGNRRPDKDKFLLVDPESINFDQDTLNVPWLKKDFFWGIRVKGVKAQKAQAGEVLTTKYDDFEITENTAQEGDWKITTVLGGQYFLSDKDFRQLYRIEPDVDGWHPPINRQPLKMVEITQPVRFKARWGKMEYLPAGSILVKRNSGDVYAIHREDFNASYERTDPQDKVRIPAVVKTKRQFDLVVNSSGRGSKYGLEFSKDSKDWKLDLQIPQGLDLNDSVGKVTFVLDVDETLAPKGLNQGITTKNLEQIIRAFRLMKEHPGLNIKFIINSANTYLQYVPSRFGKTLPQLANDKFFRGIDNNQKLLESIYTDLKNQGIEDPNKITLLVSRRLSIKERIMKPLIKILKSEGLEEFFQNIELRTATGQETIRFDPVRNDFICNQNPKLMFQVSEQLAISKIILSGYLEMLGKKLNLNFTSDIKNINDAFTFLSTETTKGVSAIFENALERENINARISAFNGEVGVLYYDERASIDGKELSQTVLGQMQQQGLIKTYRHYFVQGDGRKGVRVSLFDKSLEVKGMVARDEHVVAIGDAVIDTFLTKIPNDLTIPMYLGKGSDMKDYPGVIIAKDKEGNDQLREEGTYHLMRSVLDAMEFGKTWGDVKFINNLFSPNEVRDALPDSAMNSNDPGGINFDPALMDLQIKRDGNGMPLPSSQQPLSIINISGISPVIISIQTLKDLSGILDLN